MKENETLYDSDADSDFVPAKRGKNRAINDSGDDDIYIFRGITNYILQEQEHQNSQTDVNVSHAPAKRKRMAHAERTCEKETKRLEIERNYFTKPGCFNNCKRSIKCSDTFTEEARASIHRLFVGLLDSTRQKSFVLKRVNQQSVKMRRVDKDEQMKSIRFIYALEAEHVPCHEVCKFLQNIFLLGTLVLSPKSDNIITKTFKKAAVDGVVQVGQGKRSKRRTNEDSVKQCLERYHPAVSHYGREKTPHRRYSPCDLTLTDMHKEYGTCQLTVNFSSITFLQGIQTQ